MGTTDSTTTTAGNSLRANASAHASQPYQVPMQVQQGRQEQYGLSVQRYALALYQVCAKIAKLDIRCFGHPLLRCWPLMQRLFSSSYYIGPTTRLLQACFNSAMDMNARGRGVQLPRRKCFAEACWALSPWRQEIPEVVQAAMSESAQQMYVAG